MSGRSYFSSLLATSLFFAVTGQGQSATDDDQTIDVIGHRAEGEREDRPGKSVVIRPEDASRFDTKTLLEADSSLALPETGRVTAQGFAIPRIRGQDVRLTEVYVDDLLLQDAYSGLPLVDELDLRAFGELAVYQGLAPPLLPTLDGIGVIQYRTRPIKKALSSAGTTVGKPYGQSAWALAGIGHREEDEVREVRFYARRHVTDGHYEYYSDNGTPYNKTDDSYKVRENNQRSSTQMLPMVQWPVAGGSLKVLGLSQESRTGLPTTNANLNSQASQTASSRLASLAWRRQRVTLRASGQADRRVTTDPNRSLLTTAERNAFSSTSAGFGADLDFLSAPNALRLSIGQDDTRAKITSDGSTQVDVSRATDKLAVGSSLRVAQPLTVEAKAQAANLADDFHASTSPNSITRPPTGRRSAKIQGGSLAGEWRSGAASTYVQAGQSRRAASLLEEFGDGGQVLGSADLAAERAFHRELGVTVANHDRTLAFTSAVFQDDTLDRITLAPALAGSLRAQNLGKTRIRGLEGAVDGNWGDTHAFVTFTRLSALDVTDEARARALPFVAERYASSGLEEKFGTATLRETSRYQSEVYRDLGNAIVVPAYWVHDLSSDVRILFGDHKLDGGLAVLNFTNVRKLSVSAPGPRGNDGATSYSDVSGYALPGRQWRFSLALEF